MEPRDKQQLAKIATTEPAPVNQPLAADIDAAGGLQTRGRFARIARGFLQLLLPVAVIATAYGAYKYLEATKPETRKRPPQETVFSVSTMRVAFKTHQPYLTLYGTTVAGREVEMRSLVAGRVKHTGQELQSGGEISSGEVLLEIDPFDYEVAIAETEAQITEAKAKLAETKASILVEEGNLKSAREQLSLAETDLKRAVPLAGRGTVSERTVDDRRLIASQRRQAATQMENNLKVWAARQVQQSAAITRLETTLRRERRRLEETRLTAPFDAYVADVGAQVGRMLSVNDRVATLIDKNRIDARFTLTDQQFGRLTANTASLGGRAVEVTWNAGRKPLVYQAKIERIDARVSAESGGVQVYARIDDPSRPVAIRPGVFVELRLADTAFERVAKVPTEAVYDGNTIYAVADGRLKAKRIEIVGSSAGALLIAGDLKSGERIVTTRLSRPGDGVRVKERASHGS